MDEVAHIGNIDDNHYFTSTNTAFYLYSTSPYEYENSYSFRNWVSKFDYDINSTFANGIRDANYYTYEYNNSATDKTIKLKTPMVDAKGTKYNGAVTLQPYTSVELIKASNILFNRSSQTLNKF